MYFLESICEMDTLNPIWNTVGFVVKAIWIGIPILLIIFGMIDLGKAVIASKEDEIKKATQRLGRRFLAAVAVFLVVWLVQLAFNTVASFGGDAVDYDESSWKACWCKINKGTDYEYKNTGTDEKPKYECIKK